MIILTQDQRDALAGDYDAGRLEPVEAVPGLYYVPDRLAAIFPGLADLPVVPDLLEAAKAHMIGQAAALRWQWTLVFAYDGVANAYADPAIAPLAAKILALDEAASDAPVNFKLSGTVWRSWTRTQLRTYGAAIDAHIQACFDHEKILSDAIEAAADLDALRAIDVSAGWP